MAPLHSDLDTAYSKVQELSALFVKDYAHYHSVAYIEDHVRLDFINKFFIAFGWDVNHEVERNPFEQEVRVEPPVKTGKAQRHADYAFHIAPNFRDPRFLVEAKRPRGEIASSDNYFQAIRYGWYKQNPLAGLTNFEHFHLLDCRFRPDIDTAMSRCLEKWALSDYRDRDKFARLYWLISREAVASGSLEKYAAALPQPSRGRKQGKLFAVGYVQLNEAFIAELNTHRDALAHAFKREDSDLDSEALTELTQRTLDRLVFMRFLEDKLIEPLRFVDKFGEHGTAWRDFIAASRRLDRIYNGIVFKKHDILDSPDFDVNDAAFSRVVEALSTDHYDFNHIPIHILGSIYEEFLGNIIHATAKQVKLEPKPEVRKAGGVYYTPEYIVRFIVESTVGQLIAGKTPDEIAEMRFADIACGSGSFLLEIYDLLLQYHAKYYNDNPKKARKRDCIIKDEVLHLSIDKKRDILLNNIYGVDIDPQAVEVTQLSLYLKLLDDETIGSTRERQLKLHAAILPPLNRNIVCGNSLIGTEFLHTQLFKEEQERAINPMSFRDRFPSIMSTGGFDCIVGNPPYLNVDDTWGKGDPRLVALKTLYPHIYNDKTDVLFYFLARAVQLSKARVGYIVSRAFLEAYKADKLRGFLASSTDIREVVDFRNFYVFPGVGITTSIVNLVACSRKTDPCGMRVSRAQ